jgi:flagellar biosynthetic protein FlhB
MKEEKRRYFFDQYYNLQFFADDSGTGEKTEEATPRQKRRARERGDVPKSQDLVAAFILLFSLFYFYIFGKKFLEDLSLTIISLYKMAGDSLNDNFFHLMILRVFVLFFKVVGPFLLVVLVAGILGNISQVGFLFVLDPLKPNLNKLNPISGLKRIFSFNSVNELWKSILKLTILFYIPYQVVKKNLPVFPKFLQASFGWSISTFFGIAFEIALKIILVFLIIAIIDYFMQRRQWNKKLKMSKYEVKKEYKETEGDPQVKQEMRKRAMKMLMNQMMKAVPEADVVITNPTHIAVALKYKIGEWPSPKVLAKGEGPIAQRIKELAKKNDVPIVENKPLARQLYALVPIGGFLPTESEHMEMLQAVAEIISAIYRERESE